MTCAYSRHSRDQLFAKRLSGPPCDAPVLLQYQRPIPGHTEVMCMKAKGGHAVWRATEGVYFHARTAEDH